MPGSRAGASNRGCKLRWAISTIALRSSRNADRAIPRSELSQHDQNQNHHQYQAEPAAAIIARAIKGAAAYAAESAQKSDDKHDEQYGSEGHEYLLY